MATLTYWYSACNDDADAYSIITKTKKEAVAQREQRGEDRFDAPVKKTFNYTDAFDLFNQATSEYGGRSLGYSQD